MWILNHFTSHRHHVHALFPIGVMCGVVMKRQTYHVVVAGGLNQYGYQDVVEVYNVATLQWTKGKHCIFTYKTRKPKTFLDREETSLWSPWFCCIGPVP